MTRVAFLAMAVWAAQVAAEGVTLNVEGEPVALGAISPGEGERLVRAAAKVTIISPGGRWSLKVRALRHLTSQEDGSIVLPISRLRFGLSGTTQRVPLSLEEQVVLADQSATGVTGRLVTLDYGLLARWGDRALSPHDSYGTDIVFSVTSEEEGAAVVSPNPFSPNGDGVKDRTELRFGLDAPGEAHVRVAREDGTPLRELRPSTALGSAEYVATWDGQDAEGQPAPEGRYRFVVEGPHGEPLASASVVVERHPPAGTAAVLGRVQERGGLAQPGVQVTLRSAGGLVHGTTTTDASGAFRFTGVGAGQFSLSATKPLYLPYEGPVFDVVDGTEVRQDLVLVHNHSLIVGLNASSRRVAVGGLVALEAIVRSVGTTEVDDARVQLTLPAGLVAVRGSLSIDGVATQDEGSLIPLGRIELGATRRVRLLATLTAGHEASVASAEILGSARGEPVRAGPATVRIEASRGELTGLGGLFGRLCFDVDGDGHCAAKEPAARNAVIFLEDGSHAQTDHLGRYHLAPVQPGRHVLLGGPGPLVLGARPGALPSLPRVGSARTVVRVAAGQYVARDLALPPPPGFADDGLEGQESSMLPVFQGDEGEVPLDIAPRPGRPAIPPPAVELEEGVVAEDGTLFGPGGLATGATPSSGTLSPFPDGASATSPLMDRGTPSDAAPGPLPDEGDTRTAGGTAVLGLGELSLTLGKVGGGAGRAFTPRGRLALTLQHEFSATSTGSLVVDTGRDGRSESLSLFGQREGYTEFGDDALVGRSNQELAYARLDLPTFYAQVGRMGTALTSSELIVREQSLLGAELGLERGGIRARAFAGFSAEAQVVDVLAGADSTGPYRLSRTPVLPGSEQVDVEIRDSDGEVRQRLRFARGVDYFLDVEQGVLDLTRPLPSRSPSGDAVTLVVRYQVYEAAPLLSGFLAGGRAELRQGPVRAGLTGLYEHRPEQPLAALAVDGTLALGRLTLGVELGLMPLADAPLQERSATRTRASVEVAGGLELFAFGLNNGRSWEPDIRTQFTALSVLSPFALLDVASGAPLLQPSLSQLFTEDSAFPFFLSESRNRVEFGAGTRAEVGPVRGLALVRRGWEPGEEGSARDHDELAVVGVLDERSSVFASHTTSAAAGELFGALGAERIRESLVGARVGVGSLLTELDFLHRLTEDVERPAGTTQRLMLKARLDHFALLQPAASLSQTWLDLEESQGTLRQLAAGLESSPAAGVRAFAYLSREQAEGGGVEARQGTFVGLQLERGAGRSLTARYDLSEGLDGPQHRISWSGRYRLIPALTLLSDGRATVGLPEHLLRLGVSYVPTGGFRALGRVDQELNEGTRTRTAAVDAGLRLSARVQLDSKYLLREERQGGFGAISGLAGLAVNIRLPSDWDVVIGARHLRDAAGGAWGTTLEAGYTVARLLRLGAGVNLAQRKEVFTIERQSPGVFLNLTAAYGGVLGGGAPTRTPEPGTQTAPSVAKPAPSTATASATTRTIRGRLYADRNGNGALDADEPVFAGIRIEAGDVTATTDKEGVYVLSAVPSTAASVKVDPSQLPFGYVPDEQPLPPGAGNELTADLLAGRGRFPMGKGPFAVNLPEGKLQVTALERVRFPLAAWVAGLPLSAQEANQLERLAERVHADKDLRLIIVSHAQTRGSMRGATKRAISGAQALRRYLQAAQMVPPKKMAFTVIEPIPGFEDPLGHIELVLARVAP